MPLRISYTQRQIFLFKRWMVDFSTQNGKYTISLRNCSEAGLSGSIRLNVYLVHNDNGSIEYIWKKRLDYYDDFTPYIKFAELNNEVIVKFHKNI